MRCMCVCVRQGRSVVGQLFPTGNGAAALLGQYAIISFIIIAHCSTSSNPSQIFEIVYSKPAQSHTLTVDGKSWICSFDFILLLVMMLHLC